MFHICSEKPTARHERGFVADSPTRRARPKENLFKKSASSVACATHRATHIYMLSLHYFVRHILFIYHIRDFRHIGDCLGVLLSFFRLFIGWSGSWLASLATCVLKQLMLLFYLVVLYLLFELRSQP